MRLTPPKRSESLSEGNRPTKRVASFFERVATINNDRMDKLESYDLEGFMELRNLDPETADLSQVARALATLIGDLRS